MSDAKQAQNAAYGPNLSIPAVEQVSDALILEHEALKARERDLIARVEAEHGHD